MMYQSWILFVVLLALLPACSNDPDPWTPPSSAVGAIRDAVAAGDVETLPELLFQLQISTMLDETYPESVFNELLAIMASPAALGLDGAGQLFFHVKVSWDELAVDQRDALLEHIRVFYDQYSDFMACFVMTELLGEQFATRDALDVVRVHMRSETTMPRALMPHALEELHRNAADPEVAAEALELLQSMTSDRSPEVCGEAHLSLQRLVNRPRPSAG